MAFSKYFAFGILALAFAGSYAAAQPDGGRPPLPPGVIPPPDYEPSPEELAAAEDLERTSCGVCRFYSPANEACIDVPERFACEGNKGRPAGKQCGPCSYFESEEGDGIGHCIDIASDTCNVPLPKPPKAKAAAAPAPAIPGAAAAVPGKPLVEPAPAPSAAAVQSAEEEESAEDEDEREESADDEEAADADETEDEVVHLPPPHLPPPHARH